MNVVVGSTAGGAAVVSFGVGDVANSTDVIELVRVTVMDGVVLRFAVGEESG